MSTPTIEFTGIVSVFRFSFLFVSENSYFAMLVQVSSFPQKEEILDYPAYGPIIRVFIVIEMVDSVMKVVSYV